MVGLQLDVPQTPGAIPVSGAQNIGIQDIANANNAYGVPVHGAKSVRIDNRSNTTILATYQAAGQTAADQVLPIIVNPQTVEVHTFSYDLDEITIYNMAASPLPTVVGGSAAIIPVQGQQSGFVLLSYTSIPIQSAQGVGSLPNAIPNVLTTRGDLLYEAAAGAARLGIGTPGTFLGVSNVGDPQWQTPNYIPNIAQANGDIPYVAGGLWTRLGAGAGNSILAVNPANGLPAWYTSNYVPDPLTTQGDMLYKSATATARLPIGAVGQILAVTNVAGTALPQWNTSPYYPDPMTTAGDMLGKNNAGVTTRIPAGIVGQVLSCQNVGGFSIPEWSTSIALPNDGNITLTSTVAAPTNAGFVYNQTAANGQIYLFDGQYNGTRLARMRSDVNGNVVIGGKGNIYLNWDNFGQAANSGFLYFGNGNASYYGYIGSTGLVVSSGDINASVGKLIWSKQTVPFVQSGVTAAANVGANSFTNFVINFPTAFATVPNVTAIPYGINPGANFYNIGITAISTSSVTIEVQNTNNVAGNVQLSWIAIGS